jgi:hypothetical protein
VILVRRLARPAHPEQRGDLRNRSGERVQAVRDDADGAGDVAERQFGDGDREIEEEDLYEYSGDGPVSLRGRRRWTC